MWFFKRETGKPREKVVAESLQKPGDAPNVDSLVKTLATGDISARKAAVEALARTGDARAVQSLIAALKDQERDVREAAAMALGTLRDPRAIDFLIFAVLNGNAAAVRALVQIGKPAVRPLVAVLKGWYGNDGTLRGAAIWALGELKDPEAVEALVAIYKGSGDPATAIALEKIGQPADPVIQAQWAVAMRDWNRATLLDAPGTGPLITALNDTDSDVRKAAAQALGKIRDVRAVGPLIAVLNDEDWDVRQAAAQALGEIGDARAVQPLIRQLEAKEWKTRRVAAEALATLYRGGKLDEQARQRILAMRKVMAEPHADYYVSSDCSHHTDSAGIGVTL